jgi:hypothetical protein
MARTALKTKTEKYSYMDSEVGVVQRRTVMLINSSKMTLSAVCNKSGVSRTCILRWVDGHTKRPQVPTLNAVLKVFGYELDVVKRK